jgi:3-deoxy-D-manno-octulosonic-acid transferase
VELPRRLRAWREALRHNGPLWALASTHEGEEEQILARCGPLRERFPELRLLIAPRHTHRAQAIVRLAQRFGLRAEVWSQMDDERTIGALRPNAIVLDTLGKLADLVGLADLVFIGGSLVDHGGHNPIEAALHGRAILLGPSQYNFRDVIAPLKQADAVEMVEDADLLVARAAALLADPARRQLLGERAREVVRQCAGATAAILNVIEAGTLQ